MEEQIRKKLKSVRGESLVELLASILIGGLSVMLLATIIMTSARVNDSVQKSDEDYYRSLEHAEAQDVPMDAAGAAGAAGHVKVSGDGYTEEIPVTYYGGDGVLTYKMQPHAGGGGGGGTS